MSRPPRIYLAGPDVFRPDAVERGRELQALCLTHGAHGLFPIDNQVAPGPGMAERIRAANLAMIRDCDAVVADMAPFRGPAMDGGTAYEMGFAAALGRIVVGYQDAGLPPFHLRVAAACGAVDAGQAGPRDADGMLIETFPDASGRPEKLADNLMMACGLDGFAPDAEAAIVLAATLWRQRT